MGMNMSTDVVLGIPVDLESFFESYYVIPDWAWCEHREKFDEETQFCPTCGRQRPTKRKYTRPNPDAMPQPLADAVRAKLGEDAFDSVISHPRDLEYEFQNGFDNGLRFLSNSGEGTEDVQYFLGVHLAGTYKYDGETFETFEFGELSKLRDSITERASKLGIEGDCVLAVYNFWM